MAGHDWKKVDGVRTFHYVSDRVRVDRKCSSLLDGEGRIADGREMTTGVIDWRMMIIHVCITILIGTTACSYQCSATTKRVRRSRLASVSGFSHAAQKHSIDRTTSIAHSLGRQVVGFRRVSR